MFANHDRIHHQGETEIGGRRGDGFHDLAVAQRTGLGGLRRNVFQNRSQLGQYQFRRYAIHARDPHRVLHGEQRDHSLAVHAKLMECLQVGLDTCASDGVGAGDG